jgi:peptidoglycan/LPS O-acetylase OafA/YrhL
LARYLNLTPLALQLFILGVGLPITVAVCYVFHLVFERPFIRRRDAMSSSIAGSGISERVTVA